jgi:hypothetical protein
MTAKKATRSDPAFAAAVAGVQPALTAWRKRRKYREPMPDLLWHATMRLARDHGLSPVAQELRVNYTVLKRRVLANPLATPAGGDETEFVEMPVAAGLVGR